MQRNPLLEAIADPSKNFLAFLLIGIFGLGIISTGISNLLLDTLGSWVEKNMSINKVLFQLGVIGLIGITILSTVYFTNLTRRLRLVLGREEIEIANVVPLTDTFFGLVAIASFSKRGKMTPAEIAIRHHWGNGKGRLRYCWLLCTPDALESTQQFLKRIEQDCIEQRHQFYVYYNTEQSMPPITQAGISLHVRLLVLEPERINDPNHVRELVDSLYDLAQQQTGLPAADVIADYTGGTKSMTAGMVLACSAPDRTLQYLVSQYDEKGSITDSQLMKVILSYRVKPVRA